MSLQNSTNIDINLGFFIQPIDKTINIVLNYISQSTNVHNCHYRNDSLKKPSNTCTNTNISIQVQITENIAYVCLHI